MGTSRPGLRRRVRMGLTLGLLLLAVGALLPAPAVAAPVQSRPGEERWVRVYTVRPGDTLAAIALTYDVALGALMQANGLRNPDHIVVGQELIIPDADMGGPHDDGPHGDGPGSGGPVCADGVEVRRGETLTGIAERLGIDAYTLARANGLYNLNDIYAGQWLCLPGRGGPDQGKPAPVGARDGGMGPGMDGPRQPDGPVLEGPEGPKNGPADGPMMPAGQKMGDGPAGPMRPDGPGPEGPGKDGPPVGGPDHPMDGPDRDKDGFDKDGCNREGRDRDGRECGPREPDGKGRSDATWKGSYFQDKYFSEFVAERQDAEVRFNWYTGKPFDGMPEDRFSVRWEKIEFFREGWYRFTAVADDGVRVIVDDQTVIDGWKIQPATEYKGDIYLRGGSHKLVVEYYEEAEDAQIAVDWEPIRR